MVESTPDPTAGLLAEKKRLEGERDNLVNSIAQGVPAASVRKRETDMARIDAELAAPRAQAVDTERLRATLERAPRSGKRFSARSRKSRGLLIRRLLGPLEMPLERPEDREHIEQIVRWEAETKPAALFDGLIHLVASPTGVTLFGLTAKPPKVRWMLPLAA